MTRFGWGFLIVILLVAGIFLSFTRFGGPAPEAKPDAAPAPLTADADRRDAGGYPVLAVPVAGVARAAIADNWGDPRDNGKRAHHGTDIMAAGGTRVIAAAPGRIEKLFESRAGGTTLYVRSPDRAWQYYYAHLAGYAPGVHEGQAVRTGDLLGFVGDTGNAGAGNFHLHFGLSRMRAGDRWWGGEPVNPYPLLARTRDGG